MAMTTTDTVIACMYCGRPGELHRSLDGTVLPYCPNFCHFLLNPPVEFRRFLSEAEAIQVWNELNRSDEKS